MKESFEPFATKYAFENWCNFCQKHREVYYADYLYRDPSINMGLRNIPLRNELLEKNILLFANAAGMVINGFYQPLALNKKPSADIVERTLELVNIFKTYYELLPMDDRAALRSVYQRYREEINRRGLLAEELPTEISWGKAEVKRNFSQIIKDLIVLKNYLQVSFEHFKQVFLNSQRCCFFYFPSEMRYKLDNGTCKDIEDVLKHIQLHPDGKSARILNQLVKQFQMASVILLCP